MDHSSHHSRHHNHHQHHHSRYHAASTLSGELIKQSSENEMRVCIEHKPEEFPMLMTATKSDEEVVFDVNVNEYEHVHIEKSMSQSIVNFGSSEFNQQKDHMRTAIDTFRDKKMLSDEERKRMSIILNAANDIKDLCKDHFQIISSDHDLFCKMIKEKWDNAVNEINDLNTKISSP